MPARQVSAEALVTCAYAVRVRPHDLVLLHGQPGLGTDWRKVGSLLPAGVRTVAPDRPGYGSSPLEGGGFEVNARAVIDELDARGIERAVLVGHSFGGGVALTVAARAPERVEALVLLAAVGPECLNGWDALLAAPVAGPVCSFCAFQLTPWFARARLRWIARRIARGSRVRRPDAPGDASAGAVAVQAGAELAMQRHVNWYVWGHARWEHGPLWRTFLTEQRALVREADELAGLAPRICVPTLLLADPQDTVVPFRTAKTLAGLLPDAVLHPVEGAGHHLPLRAADRVAGEIVDFLGSLDGRPAATRRNAPGLHGGSGVSD